MPELGGGGVSLIRAMPESKRLFSTDALPEIHLTIPCQALSHPWMGVLLTEGETKANYSRCAATLVGEFILSSPLNFSFLFRLEATSS